MADLPEGYRLLDGPPPADEYLALRREAGLAPKSRAQAVAALAGSWYACHVLHESSGLTAGMGRVVGDGGWYFAVVDLAVLADHRRRGLGDAILTVLLERIRRKAPPGASVHLVAGRPGSALYARHGFTETAPPSAGMALTLP
ncbi:GNAT family N-acetyltransferase [Actinoplanes sp. NPDC049316]|uniref:GNAT family N-acetyltransferase n=1 Tax=Actinoplanes sp. NPDC049316 TaxID=3154727 RepID=UPI003432C911